jgi:putative copper resistance protein D
LVDAVAVLARALGFMALFQAAGGALFLALFGSGVTVCAPLIKRVARMATVAAALLLLAHFALESGRLAGDLSGLWDRSLQQLLWQAAPGTALRLQLTGLLLVLVGLYGSRTLSVLGMLLVVAGFTTLGHTVDHPHRAVLAGLLGIHLLGVAFWFGALWPLRQAVTLESPARAAAVLERFSRLAIWLVPALLLAGATLVVLLVPGFAVFTTPYGELLLGKMLGFAVLMYFAALNKLRLTPALRRNDAGAAPRLRRSLLLEYLLIGAVLAITAWMTGLYSPD